MKLSSIQTSFRFKVLFVIVSVAFVCIGIVSSVSYIKSKEALEAQSINQFSSMGETMKNRLTEIDQKTKIFAERLGKNRLIEGLFLAYEGAFFGASLFPGEDLDIMTSQYEDLEKTYAKRTDALTKDFSLKNIFLASLDSQILFSSIRDDKKHFLGRNLNNGAYKGTALSTCYTNALADAAGKLFFTGFSYNKINKEVNAFYCVKQFAEFDHLSEGIKKGEVMGIVIIQIDVEALSNIVTQRVGMGKTGQAYLVGYDKKLRTDFFVNKEKFNALKAFKNDEKIESSSVNFALEGKTGTQFTKDPNGKDVLSYYTPIKMFDHTWALVAEVQEEEMFASVRDMILFVSILSIAALIVIVFIGFLVTKKLVSPIVGANEVLGEVATEVNDNANKMKDNSEGLSDSANQIAAAIQETVSTLDELSSMVNKNLENVELSKSKSEESKDVAEKGKVSVTNMIGAMGEINTSNEEIVNEMNNISQKMTDIISVINEIGEKTNVINDIVFQTKLLSFNASVEAARAGEHGKGFAVVAEEVGSLATASGKAATEISTMLDESVKTVEGIVSESKSKLDSISSVGQEKVEIGTKTAKECEQVLDQILVNVVEVNDKVSEITNASNEQASGIKEVTKAMSQLDEMTHNTSNISVNALESSEVLNSASSKLTDVVSNLGVLVSGKRETNKNSETSIQNLSNVTHIKRNEESIKSRDLSSSTEEEPVSQKAVGSSLDVPSSDDERFDDV
jgi:methyl-accepting chemotaxis protein